MLRSLAALVFVAGAVTLIAFLAVIGEVPGQRPPERHLRAMKKRRDAPATYAALSYADWRALPHGAPLATYAPLEQHGAMLVGWVQRMLVASDGDLHLELVSDTLAPDERAHSYATAEITPGWRRGVPAWEYPALLAAFRPNHGGETPWDSGPCKIRLGGWLLYDAPYDANPTDDAVDHGAPRLSGWELHPVTRIEVWDAADSAWKEIPR